MSDALSSLSSTGRNASGVHVVAHRTGQHLARENTLTGLQACIDMGVEWAEIDVRQTSDGYNVLVHDENVDRTTSGTAAVAERSLAYIRSLHAGQGFRGSISPIRIPTLREALELAKSRIRLYLDCKSVDPKTLVADVRDAGMIAEVMIYIDPALQPSVRQVGGQSIPLITFFGGDIARGQTIMRQEGPTVLETFCAHLSSELIEMAGKYDTGIGCLTLWQDDRLECWHRAIEMGVDWIMTDFPRDLRAEIDSFSTQ